LSKQRIVTFPATFIFNGAIQKIFFFFSLCSAIEVPTYNVAGSDAGTAMVTISKASIKINE
jgi:hypothetical protein